MDFSQKNTPSLLSITSELVEKDFSLRLARNPANEEELIDWLADHIADLLEHRLEHLFSVLYIMDVDERAVRAALEPNAGDFANVAIAKLVVNRLRKKAETRLKYATRAEDSDW